MQDKTGLNDAQSRVVEHAGSHLLVTAGPGTGKTHTLTLRAARLAGQMTDARKILLVTFTNRAAGELQSRLALIAPDHVDRFQIGTFHSLAAGILRRYGHLRGLCADFSVTLPEEIETLAKDFPARDPSVSPGDLVLRMSRFKARVDSSIDDPQAKAFAVFLRTAGHLDFDDILRETVFLLRENPGICREVALAFAHVCVDEYQDVSSVQEALLLCLSAQGVLLTVIGDPDQSIYGFRGAGPEYFERFNKLFAPCTVLRLEVNYRCARRIVSASSAVIASGPRFEHAAFPEAFSRVEGELSVFEAPTARAEARYIARSIREFSGNSGFSLSGGEGGYTFADMAVLYRLNAQAVLLAQELEACGLPCRIFGSESEPNGRADVYQARVEKISLMSMHAAKGLEFPVVILAGCESFLLPVSLQGFSGDVNEERRLFYVGMTRARELLLITYSRCRPLWGQILNSAPSPFLCEIPSGLFTVRCLPPERNRRVEARAQLKLFG
jgi:DNA helicase-2/ATP-dependent DNA helicase PcrA